MEKKSVARRMNGGQAVVECIRQEGVGHVFCVPGESYTAALDAFEDAPEVTLITNRHEGAACFMADAYAKTTRNVGVCFVTRGPGATNASIGIHAASQGSTPLVLLAGQVTRARRGREAGQEIEFEQFFGHMAKWVVEVRDPSRIPSVVAQAFHLARSGRPGPVVVAFPRDVLEEVAEYVIPKPIAASRPRPDPALLADLIARLNGAQKPVLIVGPGVQYSLAREALVAFVEKFHLPAITSGRHMDAFPNNHPNYVGNLAGAANPARDVVRESDLLVVLGDRLMDSTTMGYQLIRPDQPLIHIDRAASVIGQNFSPTLAIVADPRQMLEDALGHSATPPASGREGWIRENHEVFLAWNTPRERSSPATSMERVMTDLREALPRDAIVTQDSGLNQQWIQRFLDYSGEDSFLSSSVGCMGYGLPAGIAAKLAHPERTVVSTSGDGGFMMSGHELATAMRYGVKTTHLIFNNSNLATISMHHEAEFPDRDGSATGLTNPDFAALARAYGAEGYRVERDEQFMPAFRQALRSEKPAIIEIITDLENITPDTTMAQVREKARAGR